MAGTTPMMTRRLLAGGLAALPFGSLAQPSLLLPTPPGTAGPFYPVELPADSDADLVMLRGSAAHAAGVVAHIGGRVLGTDGAPVPGALIEIWQCDAHGRYHHPGDRNGPPRDAAFQGYGRVRTRPDGGYAFRTIRPVAYPGRTPHIHFAVQAPGWPRLVTQMYVAGERLNNADFLYRALGDRSRQGAVTVPLAMANGIEAGALAGTFDIVLAPPRDGAG